MNTKLMTFVATFSIAFCARADKELVDGYTWEYTVNNGEATVTGVEPASGRVTVPQTLGHVPVRVIGPSVFESKGMVVRLQEGVQRIESQAFWFSSVEYIPSSVTYIGYFAIAGGSVEEWHMPQSFSLGTHTFQNANVGTVFAQCDVIPESVLNQAAWGGPTRFYCKRQYAKNWIAKFGASKFAGYIDDAPEVEIVSAAVRENDPTVMDVVYKVYSDAATVKVRALAYQNGERSFANVIRPSTFIDGTDVNIGDAIAANVEHKLSWRVSSDWKIDLAKVKFEVLAVEDDLLPLELQTIPQTATHQKMKISWNQMTSDKVYDALLWLYADGDAGLTLEDGNLKNGANILASNDSVYIHDSGWPNHIRTCYAVPYVFGKMGYEVLSGEDLEYARRVTQLELPVNDVQQYAVKKY